jgi:hypothetical protein
MALRTHRATAVILLATSLLMASCRDGVAERLSRLPSLESDDLRNTPHQELGHEE